MKGYFRYSTHDAPESHNYWCVLGEKDDIENVNDSLSPWNAEEALIRTFIPFPLNCIIVLQANITGTYFLILKDPQSEAHIMTHRDYSWEDVVNHAALFKGRSFKAAQRILKSKKL